MDVVHERCCGLDLHKRTVVACLFVAGPRGKPQKEIRTFGTMTAELLDLADWLAEAGCTHVAMESTGVFWKPIYNLLEGQFTLLLVNAQHIKAVPGRKTDVKDCEWIAELLRHGLLRPSFVPERPQRELRELTRYRTTLGRERSAEVNRLQKTLEGANIKLAAVASNIVGRSARAMLDALVAGAAPPAGVAQLARGRLREKLPQLEQALEGRFTEHQRFLIAQQLAHLDYLDDPSAAHLAAWAGMAPGNHESAGKRLSSTTRKGSPALRALLVEAGHAAGRTKSTYLAAQYHRLTARRGKKRAAMAVGHTILVIVYHLLKRGTTYEELGGGYFDERDRQAVERRLVRRLEALGNKVVLEPRDPAA